MPKPKKAKRESLSRYAPLVGKLTKVTKVFKSLKILKPLVTVGSLGGSVFAYSFSLGLWFSFGFVLMLLVHELGHVAALRRKGFRASAPIFIPMLGAVIFAPNMGNRDEEAYVGYAGPLVGGAAAVVLLAVTVVLPHPPEILRLVTYTALFINVFNLIPIRPLDGGRVTQAVGPWFKWVGMMMLIGLTIVLQSPALLIIWILVLGDIQMHRKVRAGVSWFIFITMMIMELGSYGNHQGLVWTILDLILGWIMSMTYTVTALRRFEDPYVGDARPELGRGKKIYWFGMYVLLAVALIGFMLISGHYLPPKAKL